MLVKLFVKWGLGIDRQGSQVNDIVLIVKPFIINNFIF